MENNNNGCLKKIIWLIIIAVVAICLTHQYSDGLLTIGQTSTTNSQGNLTDEINGLYLTYQEAYASEKNIKLNDFSKERRQLYKVLPKIKGEWIYIEEDNILSARRYKMTVDRSEYLYTGETKDNRPHGRGVLLQRSETHYGKLKKDDRYYNILYMGEFSEGRYDGYGLEFYQPNGNMIGGFNHVCTYEPFTEEYTALYQAWLNYVTYEGEFKKGRYSGKGNKYKADLSFRVSMENIIGKTDSKVIEFDEINVGRFKDNELDGKVYINGIMRYVGEMKNGKMHGSGTTYYNSGEIEYKGKFKNDMRDGKGTLYDKSGNVINKGMWRNDDYK